MQRDPKRWGAMRDGQRDAPICDLLERIQNSLADQQNPRKSNPPGRPYGTWASAAERILAA
eukprot:4793366-Pyramimonas_sp.AAC.1